MMADQNRYAQLLSILPEGDWYDANGTVVPYRTSPYVVQFVTDLPDAIFGLFRNGVFLRQVKSDGVGNITEDVLCELGENNIWVVQDGSQDRVQILLTCKKIATNLAASAEMFELLDEQILRVKSASVLANCFGLDLSEVWGTRVGLGALYPEAAYRDVLGLLHEGQRLLAGKSAGLRRAIESICRIPPFDVFRRYAGPRWVIGLTFLENDHFQDRPTSLTNLIPPAWITNIKALRFAGAGVGQLGYAAGQLASIDPVFGFQIVDLEPGLDSHVIFQHKQRAILVAKTGPYGIVVGINNRLHIDIDGMGLINIILPGGALSSATVVATINAALAADPRYGVPYSNAATVTGASFVIAGRLAALNRFVRVNPGGQSANGILTSESLPMQKNGLTFDLFEADILYSALPIVPEIFSFTINRAPIANGWFADPIPTPFMHDAEFFKDSNEGEVQQQALGALGATLERDVSNEIRTYDGWTIELGAWVKSLNTGSSVTLGFSFDGGVSWIENIPFAIPTALSVFEDPVFTSFSLRLDPEATGVRIRLRYTGAVGALVETHRAWVRQPQITGAFLASKTIPRSRHRSFYGHLLLAWCVDALNADERLALGLTSPPWPINGQIDRMSAASVQVDRFDVTEYDLITGRAINLVGLVGEPDFADAQLVNLEIAPNNNFRFARLLGSVAGVQSEDTTVLTGPPFNIGLAHASDQVMANTIVLINGIPLTQDLWSYTNETVITIDPSAVSVGDVVTVLYRLIYRVTSNVLDLGNSSDDYLWMASASVAARQDATRVSLERDEVLFLDFGNLTASLDRPIDPSQSIIISTFDGTELRQLSPDDVEIVTPYLLSFAPTAIKAGAILTMQSFEDTLLNKTAVTQVLEVRTAADPVTLLTQAWRTVEENGAVKTEGRRYAQIRLTLTNLDHTDDAPILGLAFKGLHLFGALASVPGIT
jgi:hypothetical protein